MSVQVQRCADCGNSPKNIFAEEVALRLLSGDEAFLKRVLAPEAVLEGMDGWRPPDVLKFEMVVTHGRAGAVSGVIRRDGLDTGFCLVIRFPSVRADRVAFLKLYTAVA